MVSLYTSSYNITNIESFVTRVYHTPIFLKIISDHLLGHH
jgi:hypothetical protein